VVGDMNEKLNTRENILKDYVNNYYIDFIPKKIINKQYAEMKQFFLENYLESYADKIISILMKLTVYFNLKMYLTDFPLELHSMKSKEYAKLVGADLYSLKIEEWSEIVKFVILEDISTIQILSNNPRFLISINGKFSNELCYIPKDNAEFIKKIVEIEGLYLLKQ
jgi:hypothetical protein